MSDLSELDDIAEGACFGFQGLYAKPPRAHRAFSEYCGGGHLWTEETTRYFKDRGRIRRVCRLCDKARKAKKRGEPKCSEV